MKSSKYMLVFFCVLTVIGIFGISYFVYHASETTKIDIAGEEGAGRDRQAGSTGDGDVHLQFDATRIIDRISRLEERIRILENEMERERDVDNDSSKGAEESTVENRKGALFEKKSMSREDVLSVASSISVFQKKFGLPEKEHTSNSGYSTQYYFKQGMRVELDTYGMIYKIHFFGRPRSERMTPTGRWHGIFEEDGEWYRPKHWEIDGISIGTHQWEVYRLWGKPTKREFTPRNQEFLFYEDKKIALEIDSDFKVINMEYRFRD